MQLSTRASIALTGPMGLGLLGPSVRAEQADLFGITGTAWRFDAVEVVDVVIDSLHHDPRGPATLGFPAPGSIGVVFVIEGGVQVHDDGAEYMFGAGSAVVLPGSLLPRSSCRGSARLLFVTMPKPAFAAHESLLPDRIAALSTTTIRRDPMLTFLLALIETVRTHSIHSHPTAEIIVMLLAGLIAADRMPGATFGRHDIVAIRAVISANCADPQFDARVLAQRLGIPSRELSVTIRGQTIGDRAAELITTYRLVLAMTLLQPHLRLSIAQVAMRSGFANARQLEAAVERVYGIDATTLLESRRTAGDRPTRDLGAPQQRLRFLR